MTNHSRDLTTDETRALLRACPIRWAEELEPPEWGGGTYRFPQIFVDGRWVELCRTDKLDDICTRHPVQVHPPPDAQDGDIEVVRQRYIEAARWGGRWRESGAFSIIDAMTDG